MGTIATYRRWVGRTVCFSEQHAEGQRMIERGIHEGVIRNIRYTGGGIILFEIDFGRAGNPTFSEFTLHAFNPPPLNGDTPSAPISAAQ